MVNQWNEMNSVGKVPANSQGQKHVQSSVALFWTVFGLLGLLVNVSLAGNEIALWEMPELILVFSFKTQDKVFAQLFSCMLFKDKFTVVPEFHLCLIPNTWFFFLIVTFRYHFMNQEYVKPM